MRDEIHYTRRFASCTSGTRIRGLLGCVKQFKRPPSEGVHLLRFRFVPAFKWAIEWTAAQDPTLPGRCSGSHGCQSPAAQDPKPSSGCSGVTGPSCPAMPLLPYVPSGLCKYCLYQYTHVPLSCCTSVCPIGMWATSSFRPERAPFGLCKYPVISI